MNQKQLITRMARQHEWWINRTPEEKELQMLALGFEDRYFPDLRLLAASIAKSLLRYELEHDGHWIETSDDLEISISDWVFKYRAKNHEFLGQCYSKRETIYIRRGRGDVEHPATVLHEMIHAYESQLSAPFREWLTLYLRDRMAKQIPPAKLRWYINASTHSLVHHCSHGVLFLLKSLDLDLRFDWPRGTVFGYGRTDHFAPIKKPHKPV